MGLIKKLICDIWILSTAEMLNIMMRNPIGLCLILKNPVPVFEIEWLWKVRLTTVNKKLQTKLMNLRKFFKFWVQVNLSYRILKTAFTKTSIVVSSV